MHRQRSTRLLIAAAALWFVTGWAGAAIAAPAPDARPTVAILYFDYAGKDEALAVLKKGLAQMLISDLTSVDGIRLIERDRIEEVLAELKLGQSAKVDAATAAKVGKLLGARYLVLGSYFDLKNTLRADARVVEVETGKVMKSTGHTGTPDDFLSVERKLGDELAKILGDRSIRGEAPAAPEPGKPPKVAPPAALKTKTALAYSRALDAADKKDKARAKKELADVVKEQPDFKLAMMDLDRLMH